MSRMLQASRLFPSLSYPTSALAGIFWNAFRIRLMWVVLTGLSPCYQITCGFSLSAEWLYVPERIEAKAPPIDGFCPARV
jgi:hypothetical protein